MKNGKFFLVISMLLYVASLPMSCYSAQGQFGFTSGWELLLFGWLDLITSVPIWLANPAILLAWLMFALRKTRLASVLATLAFCLSLTFLFFTESPMPSFEAPPVGRITGYGPGYCLWVASMGTMVIGTMVKWVNEKSEVSTEEDGSRSS